MSDADTTTPAMFRTRDLSLAAYIQMVGREHGISLRKANRQARNRFEFLFNDPNQKGRDIQVQFINSECHAFDACTRSLKKLVLGNSSSRNGGSPDGD